MRLLSLLVLAACSTAPVRPPPPPPVVGHDAPCEDVGGLGQPVRIVGICSEGLVCCGLGGAYGAGSVCLTARECEAEAYRP